MVDYMKNCNSWRTRDRSAKVSPIWALRQLLTPKKKNRSHGKFKTLHALRADGVKNINIVELTSVEKQHKAENTLLFSQHAHGPLSMSLKAGFHSGKIGSDGTFFPLVLSTPPDQRVLKIFQLFIIQVADHRFKLEQKIGTESPCAGSNLFRYVPIPCLFSWVEISLYSIFIIYLLFIYSTSKPNIELDQ